MCISHFLAVTSDDTIAELKQFIKTDASFKDGQPLLNFLIHLKSIFNGIFIAPKQAPQNVCACSMDDTTLQTQLHLLKWFEEAYTSNPL